MSDDVVIELRDAADSMRELADDSATMYCAEPDFIKAVADLLDEIAQQRETLRWSIDAGVAAARKVARAHLGGAA